MKKKKFFSKFQKTPERMAQGKQQPKFERKIRALGSEIIATRTDDGRTGGRTDDGQNAIS